jgi:putative ABC transport system permease protein
VNALLTDLRHSVRVLLAHRAFTLVTVVTLALGVGANTAIFSLVDAVLLRALPYAQPDRLVVVWEQNYGRGKDSNVVSPANYLQWQERNDVFASMAALVDTRPTLTGEGEPEEVQGQLVTSSLFSLLGVAPQIGRTFDDQEDHPGHDAVVLLSDRLWRRRFGADPGIVGRSIAVSGRTVTVVGVMRPEFRILSRTAELWLPKPFDAADRAPKGRFLRVVARLREGVSLPRAQAAMDVMGQRLRAQYPDFNAGWGIRVVPLKEQLVGQVRRGLVVLFGAVGFVLLIACVNVANLLLGRGLGREREFAVRAALGASRWRLVRQLLTEGLLLALMGGTLGVVLAGWLLDWILPAAARVLPIPTLAAVTLDGRVLAFALVASLLTAVLFGLVPALAASRPNLDVTLRDTGRGSTEGRRRRRLRGALVVAETALAVVLLTGSGLMLASLARLLAVDQGFNPEHVLTMRVLLPTSKYASVRDRVAFFDGAIERMKHLPGVRAAGAVSCLPLGGPSIATSFTVEGRPAPPPGESPVADIRLVDGDYFQALGIPLRSGRLFSDLDGTEGHRAAIINQTLARQLFADREPIGQRVRVVLGEPKAADEIVGVVGDTRSERADQDVRPMIYWPNRQLGFPWMAFAIRTDGDPLAWRTAALTQLRQLDPTQPVADISTMDALVGESVEQRRFTMALLSAFALLALLLAALGLYGVLSHSVAQRVPELGVRLALGADRGAVLRLVMGEALGFSMLGLVVGLGAATASGRLIRGLLFGVRPTEPLVFVAVSVLLLLASLAAGYLPARRAAHLDPIVALRDRGCGRVDSFLVRLRRGLLRLKRRTQFLLRDLDGVNRLRLVPVEVPRVLLQPCLDILELGDGPFNHHGGLPAGLGTFLRRIHGRRDLEDCQPNQRNRQPDTQQVRAHRRNHGLFLSGQCGGGIPPLSGLRPVDLGGRYSSPAG